MLNLAKLVIVAGIVALLSLPGAQAQTIPLKFLSLNTTNSTLVFKGNAGGVLLGTGVVINTTTTVYYLKLYNKATAPTCGTDTPVWTLPIPFAASNAAGGFVLPLGDGLLFSLGLGFCITGGIADNDSTAAAAGIVVNLGATKR
jgi:hypothetical protein